jgi:hypothetical protein
MAQQSDLQGGDFLLQLEDGAPRCLGHRKADLKSGFEAISHGSKCFSGNVHFTLIDERDDAVCDVVG